MAKRIDSASDVQRDIEKDIIGRVSEKLNNIELDSNPKLLLDAEGKTFIRPDFFSESEKIIGEIHSHVGRLKSAQQNKIAGDILKMLLYDEIRGCVFKKYIVVCGKEEYEQLNGTSYIAESIRKYKITLLYVELPECTLKRLKNAMNKQNLMEK